MGKRKQERGKGKEGEKTEVGDQGSEIRIWERENRIEPRLNPPSANRKAVFNKVNIEERE
jgi:hypothetical protein